ncbi:MAG: sulfotransferase [Alphaproteobacteria bacterium]|nr:sulfotransferase [Alphaproteobacteria bacterium]
MPTANNPFQVALNQARALHQRRQYAAAEAAYKKLLQAPGAAETVWSHLLQLYVQTGRPAQVIESLERLISLRPDEQFYYEKLANFYQGQGEGEKAVECYRRLLKRQPKMADAHFNLAFLLRLNRHFDQAIEEYRSALSLGIRQPEEVHLNTAAIYADNLRDDSAAEQALQQALSLNPSYIPALLNLANLREEQGKKEEAMALYEDILATSPDHPDALARLANLSTITTKDDLILKRLDSAASKPGIEAMGKAILHYASGKALDGIKAFPEAFAHYRAANEASRGDGSRPYDRRLQEQLTTALIQTFSKDWFQRLEPISDAAPVFICGMFRSGSTLTEQVLASHPEVTAGGEIDFFPSLVRGKLAPFPSSVIKAEHGKLREIAQEYLETTHAMFPEAKNITDKRPDNFLYLGLIKMLFPKAKIIHTTRHPLDTCLSVYFQYLSGQQAYAKDLMDTGHYFTEYRRLMSHWQALFGDDTFEMNYDQFVLSPKETLEGLLAFLGLPWADECLEFHKAKNSVKTASYWQVREPLYARSSNRWKNYESALLPLKAFLEERGIAC